MSLNNMISVVIPCYNIEKFINKTIESVLVQTYSNIELILVDDGSTDGTAIIIDEAAAKDIRIKVIHKGNGGVTSARFSGIEIANGDWIGFVDGDDYIEPDMYERLMKNAIDYDVDISHCGYQMVFPNHVDYYYNTGRVAIQDNLTGLKDLLEGSFIEPGLCNKLYKKTLLYTLLQNHVMDISIHNNEDLLMNYYLFQYSKLSVFEDFCPYHYVLRKNSATSSSVNRNKLLNPINVLKIIKNDLNDEKLKNIVNERIVAQLIYLSTLKIKENKKLIKPIRSDARKELHQLLSEILKDNHSKSIKLRSIWCSVWPWSYSTIHDVYSALKGTNHKYDI